MVKITDIFSIEDFESAVANNLIRIQRHPEKPLNIAVYTEVAQFKNHWNEVTENCRGLVYDDDYNVIARPWRKFHNLGQVNLPTDFFNGKVEITDKRDGSLGILYWDGEDYAIATKGSFASNQAIHATQILRERYLTDYMRAILLSLPGYTFLFEIHYPSNRIVLDYGDLDDIVLLGAVSRQNGYYYGPTEARAFLDWQGPTTEVFQYDNVSDMLSHMDRPNAEGYVIRRGNFMVKAKQPDYIDMHRIVTNLSEGKVWEAMKEDRVDELIDIVPDEWHPWLKEVIGKIDNDFSNLKQNVMLEFGMIQWALPENWTRKDFALAANRSEHVKFMFMLLDGYDIDPLVWDSVKPKGTVNLR